MVRQADAHVAFGATLPGTGPQSPGVTLTIIHQVELLRNGSTTTKRTARKLLLPCTISVFDLVLISFLLVSTHAGFAGARGGIYPRQYATSGRERISLNRGWRFSRFKEIPDGLIYERHADTANDTDL